VSSLVESTNTAFPPLESAISSMETRSTARRGNADNERKRGKQVRSDEVGRYY
jgi:hypothetical protein